MIAQSGLEAQTRAIQFGGAVEAMAATDTRKHRMDIKWTYGGPDAQDLGK